MELFFACCLLLSTSFSFQLFIENKSLNKKNENLTKCLIIFVRNEIDELESYSDSRKDKEILENGMNTIRDILKKNGIDLTKEKELRL